MNGATLRNVAQFQPRAFACRIIRPNFVSLACLILCSCLVLAACSEQQPLGLITKQIPAESGATVEQIFIATNRMSLANGFGTARSAQTKFGKYDISIPPNHSAGQIEWGGDQPDPAKHFATVAQTTYQNQSAFQTAFDRKAATIPKSDREVVVFVHGYNTTFAEGLFRFAQIKHDLKLPALTLHYAWPSTGRIRDYARDRDSVLFARDSLEQTLLALTDSSAERIVVVGHSLGAFLVIETLRQISHKRQGRMRDKLAGVILISPDIDAELFRQQVRDAAPLPQPFVVFSSPKDNALRLSGLLTGKPRLGSLTGTPQLADLGITFIDVSAISDAGSGHLVPATSPTVLNLIRGMGQTIEAVAGDDDRFFGPFHRGVNRLNETGQLVDR